jgi:hypothetical protein
VVVEAGIFWLVDPANSACPQWTLHDEGGHPISLVSIFALTFVPAFWACFVFLRWSHFGQVLYELAAGTYVPPSLRLLDSVYQRPDPLTFPHDPVFRAVIVLWCIFCTSPLWLMLFGCTGLAGYWPW